MSDNNKPGVLHFDDCPFMGDAFGEVGNMIVCGQTGAGKTTLLQAIVGRYTAGNARTDHDGESVE